jgi:aldose 1-epimerase
MRAQLSSVPLTTIAAVTAPSGFQVELEFEDQRAVVTEVGAGLRSYTVGGLDVVDGYGLGDLCPSGRGQMLMPWPNRLEDGSYDFDGHHQLPINEVETSTAIHGLARWLPWSVSERIGNEVALKCKLLPSPGYPFALALGIEYSLNHEGLCVRTVATNIGNMRCPFGAGAHPYLTLGYRQVDSLMLSCPASTYLESNARGIPVARRSVETTEHDFRQGRLIGSTRLDHAYSDLARGEDGSARIRLRDPERSRSATLWMDEAYPWAMLFTGDARPDVSRRSIAIEPMTCPPNAFSTGSDLIVLAPGESFEGRWGLSPS